jgi:hypothetical protein
MAITTLQGVIDGILPSRPIGKFGQNSASPIPPRTAFTNGNSFPGAGSISTATNGAVFTNASAGALPFNNPPSGQNTYLAGMKWPATTLDRTLFLVDFLWSKDINATSIDLQTIDSVQFPARDRNGSSNGDGVYIALYSYSSNGVQTSATISYTNSVGTSGKTGNMIWESAPNGGVFMPFSLDSGDLGVRSVQSVTLTASTVSASLALIAFRPIASIFGYNSKTLEPMSNAVSFGLPRIYDDSCLTFIYHGVVANISGNILGIVEYTQG